MAKHVRGVIVLDVQPDSPASRGGLKAGDIVTAVNKTSASDVIELRKTGDLETFRQMIAGAGESLILKFVRGNPVWVTHNIRCLECG